MSFIIRNKTAGAIQLNDLGLTIPAGSGSPFVGFDFDLISEDPKQIATSADLVTEILAGNLVVLDPLDGTSELSAAASQEIVEVHNDPHYRIRGGTLNQLEDVDLTGAGSPQVLTDMVLQWNNVDAFVPTTPDDLVGDALGTINNAISDLLVDGVNTTVTTTGSPLTSIQVDVDDVFLRNTGDTLDSGTLTIASGAGIDVLSGGSLTIQDGATASITTPTGGFDDPADLVNKEYVDSIAAGLDPKESVRVATQPGDTGGTAVQASPCGPGDQITGFPGIIDGVTLVADDRVLVKDRTNAQENGIYTVTTVNATSPLTVDLTRATDQDGTPANEVSAGNFTHVEQGTQNINTKWMVTGDGILTLCSDDVNWVLFSGPDTILADVGLTRVANTISLDVGDLTGGTPVITDTIAFHDPNGATQGVANTQTYSTSFQTLFQELDVVHNITGNGIVVRTADDTYASRTITASTLDDRVGLEVLNGDGVAGNPTIGLDIENLPYVVGGSPLGAISTTDRVAVYDVDLDRNVYYQVNDIAGALASTDSFVNWVGGTGTSGGPVVANSSTDTMNVVGGVGVSLTLTAGTDTIQWDLDFTNIPVPGSPLGIDGTDEIIINNGGTIEKVTLSTLISELGLDTDELLKVSSNDTTAGYLNGKLVVGTYTTLTENNDGGNETLTIDVDPSSITLGDLGDVNLTGSPQLSDGDILIYDAVGSPQGWKYVPSSSLTFDVCTLTSGSTATLDITDEIAVCDGGSTVKFSFSDIFDTLNVVNGINSNGFIVKTTGSPDTYVSRSFAVDGPGAFDGLSVTNADGSAGDPTFGLDITGTPGKGNNIEATDEFIIYNSSGSPVANEKVTGQEVADGVADILGFGGLSVLPIGGSGSPAQHTLFLNDTERGKNLSLTEFSLTWSESNIGNNDWIEIGNAVDADTGFVLPMNATIVRVTAFTVSAASNKDIDLYVDAALNSTITTIPSGTNTSVVDATLNIDVNSGSRLRLRGGSTGGVIQDMTAVLWLKWRT